MLAISSNDFTIAWEWESGELGQLHIGSHLRERGRDPSPKGTVR